MTQAPHLGRFLESVVQLDARQSPWPQTIVATKTKRPLWVACRCGCRCGRGFVSECGHFVSERRRRHFAILVTKKMYRFFEQQAENLRTTREGDFGTRVDLLVAQKSY